MRKFLFILMMVIMVGGSSRAFADTIILDTINGDPTKMCNDEEVNFYAPNEVAYGTISKTNDEACTCGGDHTRVTFGNLKYMYSADGDITRNGETINCSEASLRDIVNDNSYYSTVKIGGTEYRVKKDLVQDGFRLLWNTNGQKLMSFKKGSIDFFVETAAEVSRTNVTSPTKILNYYNDVGGSDGNFGKTPNSGNNLSATEAFMVCSLCRKCENCDKNVASSGGNPEFYLSHYCPDEACSFVWATENVEGGHEGLKCVDASGDSEYCGVHKCGTCNDPIVGVNIKTAFDAPEYYQGGARAGYSNFCASHNCLQPWCRDSRISTNAGGLTNDGAYMFRDPNYCANHGNLCHICCEKKVSIGDYEAAGNKMICSTCRESSGECCANCSAKLSKPYHELEGRKYCPKCYYERIASGSGATDLVREVSGTILDGSLNDDGSASLNCDELYKILLEQGFSDEEAVKNALIETFTNKKICPNCGSMMTTNSAGVLYCPNCNPEQVDGDSDKGSGNNSGGGGGGGGGSPSDGSWDAWMNNGMVDPNTCQHANYPVPIDATFTNITSSTHVQNWNCINCKTPQTQTYEHTFIKGKCICGYEGDGTSFDKEAPEIIEITPFNEGLKGGETVTVKLMDDTELAEIVYVCFWGDKTTVTKEISGTEAEVEIGTLPMEEGTYQLHIISVKDAAGNEIELEEAYTFTVGDDEFSGHYIDKSLDAQDNNSITYKDEAEGSTPVSD